ncbi:MAG TPA: DUF1467 family protein [Novosphingobium sp.]|nr:DUF1467 family protein [Novosphingobium sp.]HZV08952.1 DUF1467 family protein [Novosphingobium sp.]
MKWSSMLAVYLLFWVISALFVLPFGVRTHAEVGEPLVPGQADSAPANFRPGRVALRATAIAAVAFALFWLNRQHNWLSVEDISFLHPPASLGSSEG